MRVLLLFIVVSFFVTAAVDYSYNLERDTREIIGESVYRVGDDVGWGTAFVVAAKSGKKITITVDHVCNSLSEKSHLIQKEKKVKFEILERSVKHDLCVLTAPKNAKALKVADSEPEYGSRISTAGFPLIPHMTESSGEWFDFDTAEMKISVSLDECAGQKYRIESNALRPYCVLTVPAQYTSMPVDKGASGSPTVDSNGDVVGVVMASTGRLSFAKLVPYKFLKNLVSKY